MINMTKQANRPDPVLLYSRPSHPVDVSILYGQLSDGPVLVLRHRDYVDPVVSEVVSLLEDNGKYQVTEYVLGDIFTQDDYFKLSEEGVAAKVMSKFNDLGIVGLTSDESKYHVLTIKLDLLNSSLHDNCSEILKDLIAKVREELGLNTNDLGIVIELTVDAFNDHGVNVLRGDIADIAEPLRLQPIVQKSSIGL